VLDASLSYVKVSTTGPELMPKPMKFVLVGVNARVALHVDPVTKVSLVPIV
jgi:hypothetical protein